MLRRSSLRHKLAAHAHSILAGISEPLRRAVQLTTRGRFAQVVVVVHPAHAHGTPAGDEPRVGLWLSPLGLLVWRALADGPLSGKEIAAAVGQKYENRMKYLLLDMEEREVIRHDRATGGYRRVVAEEGEPGTPK
jgi:hypothetical protein